MKRVRFWLSMQVVVQRSKMVGVGVKKRPSLWTKIARAAKSCATFYVIAMATFVFLLYKGVSSDRWGWGLRAQMKPCVTPFSARQSMSFEHICYPNPEGALEHVLSGTDQHLVVKRGSGRWLT